MSTRVQRAWDRLRATSSGTSVATAEAFRAWMVSELITVSSKLPPLLRQARESEAWRSLLERPLGDFAIRKAAWEQHVASVGPVPPSYDPVRVFVWARHRLWWLCVFIDPDEACDDDQFDLELWWSEPDQRAALVCGLGHRFEFRRRGTSDRHRRHEVWQGDRDGLTPAPRSVVVPLFPDIELLS